MASSPPCWFDEVPSSGAVYTEISSPADFLPPQCSYYISSHLYMIDRCAHLASWNEMHWETNWTYWVKFDIGKCPCDNDANLLSNRFFLSSLFFSEPVTNNRSIWDSEKKLCIVIFWNTYLLFRLYISFYNEEKIYYKVILSAMSKDED